MNVDKNNDLVRGSLRRRRESRRRTICSLGITYCATLVKVQAPTRFKANEVNPTSLASGHCSDVLEPTPGNRGPAARLLTYVRQGTLAVAASSST